MKPSMKVELSLMCWCSDETSRAVVIWAMTMQTPPMMAVFLGPMYLKRRPGTIPNSENAFSMKSNQSKISSSILYFSLMKSK